MLLRYLRWAPRCGEILKWNYQNTRQIPYGDDTTYKKGMAFLDGHGSIEDWGCGTAYAKRFVKKSTYIGIDGNESAFADRVVDLREYSSEIDCIFMRHVLEHNYDWNRILSNAINSFKKRMVLVIFTPFSDRTRLVTMGRSGIPDISFSKKDLTVFFEEFEYAEESLETDTQYRIEHVFYIER